MLFVSLQSKRKALIWPMVLQTVSACGDICGSSRACALFQKCCKAEFGRNKELSVPLAKKKNLCYLTALNFIYKIIITWSE